MKIFTVHYFQYDKNGRNEHIKTEFGIGRKRLIKLLETSEFRIDVFHIEDYETGQVYLAESTAKSIVLDDLKYPGVNDIFCDADFQ